MLTEIYIEALLVDEELADQVWDKGEIDTLTTWILWWLVVCSNCAVPAFDDLGKEN